MTAGRRTKITTRAVFGALMPVRAAIIGGVSFFLAAWRLDLWRAWVYFGIVFAGSVAGVIIMITCAPGLAHERTRAQKGTKTWDKVLVLSYFILGLIVTPILAGLDVGRFGWSLLPFYFIIIGIVLYIFALIISQWAMLVNPFFEGTVRIQKDRGQQVITTGPYRWVRHPGYVGMTLSSLTLPFIVGSIYALIPAVAMIALVIIRTHLEDRTLREELEGYAEFAAKVKYRLLPGIW